MTIVEFLEARIREDEEAARAVPATFLYIHPDDPHEMVDLGPGHALVANPDRVLAESLAKRAVIELHRECGPRWVGFPRADRQEWYCEHDFEDWPCPTLRHLAAVYANHPDYREEWRP